MMSRHTLNRSWVRSLPRNLWYGYRRYVALSALLFVVGGVIGGIVVQFVELSAILSTAGFGGEGGGEFPEITTAFLVLNNTVALLVLVLSGATLGLLTAAILLFNGALVGAVVVVTAETGGLLVPVVGILPHGVLEIPALLFAASVAFRFSHHVVLAATGRREDVMTDEEAKEAAVLTVLAFVLVPIAAFIEANITTALLEGVR